MRIKVVETGHLQVLVLILTISLGSNVYNSDSTKGDARCLLITFDGAKMAAERPLLFWQEIVGAVEHISAKGYVPHKLLLYTCSIDEDAFEDCHRKSFSNLA